MIYHKEWPVKSRWITREVKIGDTPLGAHHPIRIQSMTNTNTMDTKTTVEQAIRMIKAGSEYVRITAPTTKDAENLREIKAQLKKQGYNTPIVADIHYNPKAAEVAAQYIEKVRINPGNYVDKKLKGVYDFSDADYQIELEKISHMIEPLLKICKTNGTAIRIGSNHGSLSDRIVGKYGDTPEGMAEAAMEFLRIMEDQNFHNTVISMKSSNTQVMIQSTRLLVSKMIAEGMNYPLHLGVTEAGDGEDGRIKSTAGIATLLNEGLGDTIRVSLTEAPEKELPVAREILDQFETKMDAQNSKPVKVYTNPLAFERRRGNTSFCSVNEPAFVICSASDFSPFSLQQPDFIAGEKHFTDYAKNKYSFFKLDPEGRSHEELLALTNSIQEDFIVLHTESKKAVQLFNEYFDLLKKFEIEKPVIIQTDITGLNILKQQVIASGISGSLLSDGLADGVWVHGHESEAVELCKIGFGILQATRIRISKTEFISCPTCGRTLFDMEPQLKEIKERTSHLKGLKIGVMGCIVNGPGEMADADYGYVGAGPRKITLYKGKEVVKKNVPQEEAIDELIALIKENGDWRDV